MQQLVAYNIDILRKIDALLMQLSNTQLQRPSALLFGGTIGQHLRHILEFHTCLLANNEVERFSYDRRERNLLIETEVDVARSATDNNIRLMSGITHDHDLAMESELPGSADPVVQRTTLKRELAYLADHGVHHLAMVRMVLEQELPHVVLPEHLGVAVSTRNHRTR